MNSTRTYTAPLALAAAVLLAAAACGGGGDPAATGASAARGATVSTARIDGVGTVLVDAQGAALYAANEEAHGTVLCTGACTTIWQPLAAGAGSPAGNDGLGGRLGVRERPDGTRQVTFDGRPLYRFLEDPASGSVTGNGVSDSFDGRSFTWHVATPKGVSTSAAKSGSPGDRGGYGY
jgi:predicted lipoprotein with Yx(FWY)xxD motif